LDITRACFLIHSGAPAGSEGDEAWEKANFLASNRIQLGPARQVALKLGIEIKTVNLRSERPDSLIDLGRQSLCFVGKLSYPNEEYAGRIALANMAAIALLKSQGTKIITLYSDNLAASKNKSIAMLYRTLLWHADGVVYPTSAIINYGREWYNKSLPPDEWIIEDPWQVRKHPYKSMDKKKICRILWFGHTSNAKYLLNMAADMFKKTKASESYELTVLTANNSIAKALRLILEKSRAVKPWTIRYQEWSNEMQPTQLTDELRRAHITIIPSDPNDPLKSGASHNRAVDSIQAGCLVITSRLESYKEIERLLIAVNDIPSYLDVAIKDYERLTKKWSLMRDKMLDRFSPERNLEKWTSLYSKYIESKE